VNTKSLTLSRLRDLVRKRQADKHTVLNLLHGLAVQVVQAVQVIKPGQEDKRLYHMTPLITKGWFRSWINYLNSLFLP